MQTYITTYRQSYKKPKEIVVRPLCIPVDKMAEKLPEGDMWIIHRGLRDSTDRAADIKAATDRFHKMIIDNYISTYFRDYCTKVDQAEADSELDAEYPSALLEYARIIYGPKTKKILPPLPTSRRLFGYARPGRMYLANTDYQLDIAKTGYLILEENFKRTLPIRQKQKILCKELEKTSF